MKFLRHETILSYALNIFLKKSYLGNIAVGITLGLFAISLADMETRWIAFYTAGFVCAFIFLVTYQKEKLLFITFFLSLQIDVYLRFFFEKAGSEGITIPLVIITGFALLAWYLLVFGKHIINTFNWAGNLGLPIILMLSTSFISLIFSNEHFVGLTRLIFELELFFVYWLTFNLVQTQSDMKRILNLLFITLGIQSIFYFIQSYLGITFRLTGEIFLENESIPRPGGTVSTNPAGFASYLTPTLLIGFALYLSRKQVLKIHFLSLLVLLGSAAMVLTFTRAVWAGLLLGLILVFFMTLRQHNYQRSRGSIILVTLLLAAIIFVPIMINKRLSTQYQDEGALEERIRLMRIAVNIIEANPIIGVGPGAYSHVYKNHLTPELNRGWLSEVHNEFLLRTAETGILGGIAFLLFLIGGLRQALRLTQSNNATVRVIAVGWFSSLVSLAWQMAWVPWRGFSYNAMLWLMLGLMEGIEKRLLNQET